MVWYLCIWFWGGPKSLAGLSDEHIVLFDPRRLQNMLQTDTEVYLAAMHPAIDVDSFDDFISRKMWSDHEQKPDSMITTAQVSEDADSVRIFD